MNEDSNRVLIVGGGFSGAALAIHLSSLGIASTIVESRGQVARGAAYSTAADEHLLNVPAGKMGLMADAVSAFADHVEAGGHGPQDFVSRRQFGDYVAGELARAVEAGGVTLVRDRAVAAHRSMGRWQVELASGQRLAGRAMVLANGNQPPAPVPIPGLPEARLIADPWSEAGRARIAALARRDEDVLVVGTSLTMVDVVLTLDALGYGGRVIALSRRGQVPLPHEAGSHPQPATIDAVPHALSAALHWLRDRARKSGDWRGAIDGLRPITQALWQRLDDPERARFLRHLRPWWDVHRHRIAPAAAEVLDRLRAEGRLEVIAGRALKAVDGAEGARIEIARRTRGSGMVEVAAVINCTGPLARIDQSEDPLLRQLLGEGLVRADALGLGIAVDSDSRILGAANAWAVGPMTKGRFWEITAVPDIRIQAERIARDIAACLVDEPV